MASKLVRRVPPCRYRFPPPEAGVGRLGVLGVGADFSPGTMLAAYRQGIFPWPAPEPVVWCSPDPRAIFPLDREPHWSRSLRRTMRRGIFTVTVDRAFEQVVDGCADREEGTWITDELKAGYLELHALGWAHSLEVWNTETKRLAGGIYGLSIGAAFTAESMFHRETDASKVAFAALVERLRPTFTIFDAEVMNPHLESLGCVPIARADFLARLADAVKADVEFPR